MVRIASVVGAHGLRGELRVKTHNPASSLFETLTHLTLRKAGEPDRRVVIQSAHAHAHGLWLVAIEGCRDRTAAEALRGADLYVERSELPVLPEGEHYLIDFVGLEARLPDGRSLGRVEEAIEYPASHVLRVQTAKGELEVPLTPPYVVDVRLDDGLVIVDQIDDLLEIQRKPGN